MEESKYILPKKLEKYLASLSIYYQKNKKDLLRKIIVNSEYHISEEWDYDNWNGGQHGHAVFFYVPELLFHEILDETDTLSNSLCNDLNKLINISHEHVAAVFFELQESSVEDDWRNNSGVLLQPSIISSIRQDELTAIWKPNYFRLFLSHKSEFKKQTTKLKQYLEFYGVTSFVAHVDIEPTKEWQIEIEKAVFTMDAMVPLMTEEFRKSSWTDQEVGVAIGRGVPVIPVRIGIDPYGFIGKFQAVMGKGKYPNQLAKEIYDLLWKVKTPSTNQRIIQGLVSVFEKSASFNHADRLMEYIVKIEMAPPAVIERLANAFKNNGQVAGAGLVAERLPGLIEKLKGN